VRPFRNCARIWREEYLAVATGSGAGRPVLEGEGARACGTVHMPSSGNGRSSAAFVPRLSERLDTDSFKLFTRDNGARWLAFHLSVRSGRRGFSRSAWTGRFKAGIRAPSPTASVVILPT
jgi:hypothetical protein